MAISPNYSWPLPDDTDLVKNGAEAIRDLGNAIDNTVDNLPSGALVHIKQETITAVAAVSVNDCFSSEFDNYKIIISSVASGHFLILRMRVSGSDTASAIYQRIFLVNGSPNSQLNQTSALLGRSRPVESTIELFITNPFKTKKTYIQNASFDNDGTIAIQHQVNEVNDSLSYTGFTILGGTFTSGLIDVYGYTRP